jgi:transcription initiation factor IIE alpha subunit
MMATIKALIAKGELTDKRLANILGDTHVWDNNKVTEVT